MSYLHGIEEGKKNTKPFAVWQRWFDYPNWIKLHTILIVHFFITTRFWLHFLNLFIRLKSDRNKYTETVAQTPVLATDSTLHDDRFQWRFRNFIIWYVDGAISSKLFCGGFKMKLLLFLAFVTLYVRYSNLNLLLYCLFRSSVKR